MELGSLTAKAVRNLLKKGYGLQGFCDKYECTAEDLRRRLRLLWSRDTHTADELFSQMGQNDKKSKRQRAQEITIVTDTEDNARENAANEECDEVKMTLEEKLVAMREVESSLSALVMEIESHHKRLAEAHRDDIIKLRGLSEEIKVLKATFKAKCTEYEQIVEDCNRLGGEMNKASEERRTRVRELEVVRDQIAQLHTLDIGVYSDGKIEVFNQSDLSLDETGFETTYNRIIDLPECQDLRVKEVLILARLLQAIENSAIKANVVFESEEMELAYLLITEPKS